MNAADLDAALRQAIDERLAASRAANRERRELRAAYAAQKSARRAAGLAKRHQRKLAQPTSPETNGEQGF